MSFKLTNPQLRELKRLAQKLDPHVRVGKQGLSDGFIRSLDEMLGHLELVKVKFDEFKEEKKTLGAELAEKTGSQIVMKVGNVLVLYRQNPDPMRQKIQLPKAGPSGTMQE
ncbi:MAG: YhbY family RNA-binding protein [Verrucomicrobiota bacterium]|nr:YhbY family RNA-binding protein [Verrucomicrobiota bacterium]